MEKQNELLINESKSNNLAVKSNKQIEEMAKLLSTVKRCDTLAVSECIKKKCEYPHYSGVTCIAEHQAEALYRAGYRKASDDAREVLDETFLRIREEFSLSELGKSALSAMEAELKKKYTEGGE